MVEEVKNELKNYHLTKDDVLIVGVSGGPDSMALLSVLLEYQKEIPYTLVCAHVNHNVRKESESEAEFVRSYCMDHGVVFELLSIDHWENTNFHEQAHYKRYEFFEFLLKKYHASYLFTAHHGDDLIETILMHIVRGSTLKGYRGLRKQEYRKQYQLLRPFLDYTKEEILEFVKEHHIPYVVDASNEKDKYTRNRYRKYIIPLLKKEEPHLVKKFRDFSDMLVLYENEVEADVNEIKKEVIEQQTLDLSHWSTYTPLIQQQLIYEVLAQVYQKNLSQVHKRHVEQIMKLIHSSKANAYIELPQSIIAVKKYHKLSFEHKNITSNDYHILLDGDQKLENGKQLLFLQQPEDFSNFSCCLNSEELTLPLHVRSRQNGDVIEVKGLHGHKKVKDIFIDEKIDLEKRQEWPIVTDSQGRIVWIPGLKKSKFCKTKEEKYDIILKYH